MYSVNETGHNRNVVHFEILVSFVASLGPSYNPSRAAIALPALQALLLQARETIKNVDIMLASYSIAVDSREHTFAPLRTLSTRILNSLRSTESSFYMDNSARSIVRKIQGRRVKPRLTDAEKKALAEQGVTVVEKSSAQTGYDNQADNLIKLIGLLANIPEYAPNEPDLQLNALRAYQANLEIKNKEVIVAKVDLNNARAARNQLLYTHITGLVDIAFDVKVYIKSVFGARDSHYKQISSLVFKVVK